MSELFFLRSEVERAAQQLDYAKKPHSGFAAHCNRNDQANLRSLRKLEEDVARAQNDLDHAERG